MPETKTNWRVVLRLHLAAAWAAIQVLSRRLSAALAAEFEITGPVTWQRVARRRNLVFLWPLLFWLGVLALQKLGPYQHAWRSVLIVLTVALVVGSIRLSEERHPLVAMRGERLLVRVAIGLAAIQYFWCLATLIFPDLGNMAMTTLAAGHVMAVGGNPYVEPVDPLFPGPVVAEGYKLPPAMAVGYLPLGLLFGPRGLLLTNLVLQGLVVATMVEIARSEARGRYDGVLAVLIYLSLPIVPLLVFGEGATDLLPVLLAMLGILLANRRPGFAGLAAGLSCSASLMPAAAVLPLCVPHSTDDREKFLKGLMAGLAPILIFLLREPGAFLFNILGIGAVGVGRSGSALIGLPAAAEVLVDVVAGGLWFGFGLIAWRRPLELEQRCGLAAVVILSAILILPVMRPSETLWWLPLAAIAVARPALLELTRLREGAEIGDQTARLAARLRSFSGSTFPP